MEKEIKEEKKLVGNEEFDRIFTVMAGANASVPLPALLQILGGIVKMTSHDNEDVIKFCEEFKDKPLPEIVEKSALVTCNSIIINLWKTFGEELQKLYDERQAEKPAETQA